MLALLFHRCLRLIVLIHHTYAMLFLKIVKSLEIKINLEYKSFKLGLEPGDRHSFNAVGS